MEDLPAFKALLGAPLPGESLYHYTSPAGLDGILRTRKLWASSLEYLNDAAELGQARDLMRLELEQRAERAHDRDVRDVLLEASYELERITSLHACAFSLSCWGDLLSQWVAYCPRAGGFSIGFRPSDLRALAARHGLLVGPCVYKREEQVPLIREIGDMMETTAVRILATTPERGRALARAMSPGLFAHFARVAPFVKHGSFAQEAEWRLVFANPTIDRIPLGIRVTQTMLVPYTVVDLEADGARHPFTELIVGPCAQPGLALRAATLLTEVAGLGDVTARNSWASYRAM
jgi:hypothetical protein